MAFVLRALSTGTTAGFSVKDFTWYQYFFTQCRVMWEYIGMFLLPIGQNVDPDMAVSHTVLEHGAIAGLIASACCHACSPGFTAAVFPLHPMAGLLFFC